MSCACPPLSEYTPAPCCRPEAEPPCGDRCLHPEPGAQELFDQYCETVAMLRDAAKRYREAQERVVTTQAEVMALGFEKERLLKAVEAAVASAAGVMAVEPEQGREARSGALVAPVANTVPLPDLG
jgi:hypothetical protein